MVWPSLCTTAAAACMPWERKAAVSHTSWERYIVDDAADNDNTYTNTYTNNDNTNNDNHNDNTNTNTNDDGTCCQDWATEALTTPSAWSSTRT